MGMPEGIESNIAIFARFEVKENQKNFIQ